MKKLPSGWRTEIPRLVKLIVSFCLARLGTFWFGEVGHLLVCGGGHKVVLLSLLGQQIDLLAIFS